ncbi:MAG: F-box protein [Candidatus Endonucleobacter bathymodioli]|uniref:F-box protein n=1 Tax=Candidatus Endonucleibacter bathymodioli TaxID=539814 RepID=A0AA90NPX4_9GAMM|nr:F-box protein [Candidatus Endonucleobacter bathymodioli]
MRSALSFIIIFVILSVFIPQRGISMLELIDKDKVTYLVPTSNIVKIMIPIPLNNPANSIYKVININEKKLSLNILNMLYRFVSEVSDDNDKNQETGLSQMIDAINNNECPVTVSRIDNDKDFNFMIIKQSDEEYSSLLSIKSKPRDTFASSPKSLSVDEMLTIISIKENKIDRQDDNELLHMDNCSRELLGKYYSNSSETSDDTCFVLHIPCRVKEISSNDDSPPCYVAFFFIQKDFDVLGPINQLSTLNNDGDINEYREEIQEKSTFMKVLLHAPVVLEHIFKLLNTRSVVTLRQTCKTAKRLIESNTSLFLRTLFPCFTPQQRRSLKEYVKSMTDDNIYALVTQFSTKKYIARDLLMKRSVNYYTDILFYTRSRLMAYCPYFNTQNIFSTNDSLGRYEHTPTFSPDDSYLATHHGNVSKIYNLGMSGKWMQKIHHCDTVIGDNYINDLSPEVTIAHFSPCNRYLIICRYNRNGEIYEMDSYEKWNKKIIFKHAKQIISASFSYDSRHVVTSSDDGTAKIHRLDSDTELFREVTINHNTDMIAPAIFSDNGRSVLTSSFYINTQNDTSSYGTECMPYKGLTKIHELSSDGQWPEKFTDNYNSDVHTIGFSPDGCCTMTIVDQNTATINKRDHCGEWAKKPSISIDHESQITSASFSPNSRHLVTLSADCTVKIHERHSKEDNWEEDYWSEQATISHQNSKEDNWSEQADTYHKNMSSAIFSKDGRHLIVCCYGIAIIYGLVSGEERKEKATISIRDNKTHDDLVKAVFSNDSSQVLAFSQLGDDKIVKIYAIKQYFETFAR